MDGVFPVFSHVIELAFTHDTVHICTYFPQLYKGVYSKNVYSFDCGLRLVIMICVSWRAGWTQVLAGTAPGEGQQQRQEVRMKPEEEEAWSLRSYLWSSMTLQEPK